VVPCCNGRGRQAAPLELDFFIKAIATSATHVMVTVTDTEIAIETATGR
jgi:hypothetical protein